MMTILRLGFGIFSTFLLLTPLTHASCHNYPILPQISTVAQSSSDTRGVTSRCDRSITQRVQIIADALEAQFLIIAYSHRGRDEQMHTHTHISKKTQ